MAHDSYWFGGEPSSFYVRFSPDEGWMGWCPTGLWMGPHTRRPCDEWRGLVLLMKSMDSYACWEVHGLFMSFPVTIWLVGGWDGEERLTGYWSLIHRDLVQ